MNSKRNAPSAVRQGLVHTTRFNGYRCSLPPLLDAAGLAAMVAGARRILIKPNLVQTAPPPITTPVELVAALVEYLRGCTDIPIIIGDGTGSLQYETAACFEELGYRELAATHSLELLDLNGAPLKRLSRPELQRFPEIFLPKIAFESFLISVPVLKAHTLAGVTLTLKNMIGLAPPSHYRQQGFWKKAAFHHRIQAAIADLNRYRTPDFTILDATIGMPEAHIHGPSCDPPVNRLAAGNDPVAMDSYGASLLGRNWRKIGHIQALHTELGQAAPLEIQELRPDSPLPPE